MSTIYFAICALFLSSTVSGLRAPPVVYSAVIHNEQNTPVQCNIVWSKPSGHTLQSGLFTVEQKQYYLANEQKISMGTWEARATIQEIHCGNLVLTAPFDKVNSPKTNWEFLIQSDKIISVGPSSQAVHPY
jgi:hypothetical protein